MAVFIGFFSSSSPCLVSNETTQKRATAPFSEPPIRKQGLKGCLQSGLGASPAARRTRSHHRPFRHPSGSRLTRYGSEKVRFGSRICPTYHVALASAWHACATCARAATCICVRVCTLHGTRIELTNSNHLPRISGMGHALSPPPDKRYMNMAGASGMASTRWRSC